MSDILTKNIKTLLICEDCNTNENRVVNAFLEGQEGEALINLEASRSFSGQDTFFLASITPINESDFYEKYEHLMKTAYDKFKK